MRNILITTFVIIWLVAFHYESLRYFYLSPLLHRPLPKVKFLFPPAGWIMFYNVKDTFGMTEVYGVKEGIPQLIDPHQILQTRAIGYDNINRNALLTILSTDMEKPFCSFMHRKFPYFENFLVTYMQYPFLTEQPMRQERKVIYECK